MIGHQDQIKVECRQQREDLTAIAGVDADEDFVEQDHPRSFRDGLVMGRDRREQRQMQRDGLLAAGQGPVRLTGEQLPAGPVGAVDPGRRTDASCCSRAPG